VQHELAFDIRDDNETPLLTDRDTVEADDARQFELDRLFELTYVRVEDFSDLPPGEAGHQRHLGVWSEQRHKLDVMDEAVSKALPLFDAPER
jgi:hypothetical protein